MSYNVRAQTYVVGGLGVTGQACVRFLQQQGAQVKAFDTRASVSLPNDIDVEVTLGSLTAAYFDGVDVLVLSPGLSPAIEQVQLAQRAGVEVIGDVELFARLNETPVIGITGSNGKTTVTLLTTHMLNHCGLKAVAAGNVGLPVLDTLANDYDVIVLELSSFQLETTSSLALQAATILNISDDHLDRHQTFENYVQAKQRIFLHCNTAVVWRDTEHCAPQNTVNKLSYYGLSDVSEGIGFRDNAITLHGEPLLDANQIQLAGTHNVLNVMASLALCEGLQATMNVNLIDAAQSVTTFKSAPHRCVEIANINGVRWIDDSKATNVGATLAALQGLAPLTEGNIILVAGGDAKGGDINQLADVVKNEVSHIVAMGKDAHQFAAMFERTQIVKDMDEAVDYAFSHAKPNDVVLLSPACASLDMFDNYIHRAQVFASAVKQRSQA